MRKLTNAAVVVIVALAVSGSSLATMEIHKEYRKKDPKASCLTCHVDKLPKKDKHESNDFGKKVAEAKGKDGKIDWSKVPAPK